VGTLVATRTTNLDRADRDAASDETNANAIEKFGVYGVTLLLMLFLTPLDGFTTVAHTVGFSVARLVGYVAVALALTRSRTIINVQPPVFWLWLSSALVGTAIALFRAVQASETPGVEVTSMLQMFALWAMAADAFSTLKRETLLKALTLGVTSVLVLYVLLYVAGYDVYEHNGRVVLVAGFQTNEAGLNAALGVILILGTQSWGSRALRIGVNLIGLPAALYVLLLANSRSALLSLAAGVAAFLLPRGMTNLASKLRAAVVFLAAGGLLVFALGENQTGDLVEQQVDRWTKPQDLDDLTTGRSEIAGAAWDIALENPLGYGLGRAKYEIAPRVSMGFDVVDTHNEYLRVLVEYGFLGFLLYFVGHLLLLFYAFKHFSRSGSTLPLALLIVIQVCCLSASAGYLKLSWLVFGLVSGLEIEARRQPWPSRSPTR
jgi:O-antigen ligase